jgi:serine/threonine protein kinase
MSTNYVQTRYYRAPELLLNNSTVTKQVDMWSVGCIMAELLGGKILFQGTSPINQIEKIVRIVGTPTNLDFVKGSPQGITFMKQLRRCDPVPFEQLFEPDTNRDAIDLLKKMLAFDPDERVSAAEALKHPYFADILNEAEVLEAQKRFDFTFEQNCGNLEGIKQEAFHAILEFNGIIRRVGSVDEDDFEVLTPMASSEDILASPMEPAQNNLQKRKSGINKRMSSHDIKTISSKDLSRYNSMELIRGTANITHDGFDSTLERRRSQVLKEQAQKELILKMMEEQKDIDAMNERKKKGSLLSRVKSMFKKQ